MFDDGSGDSPAVGVVPSRSTWPGQSCLDGLGRHLDDDGAVLHLRWKVCVLLLPAYDSTAARVDDDRAQPGDQFRDDAEDAADLWTMHRDAELIDEHFGFTAVGSPDPESQAPVLTHRQLRVPDIVRLQNSPYQLQVQRDGPLTTADELVDRRTPPHEDPHL